MPLSSISSIEELSHSCHVWARKRKGNAESFSTNWPLGCLKIYFWVTLLNLDKPSGAVESSCLPNPPPLSFLFTLVLAPLSNISLLKLLTDIWGISPQMMRWLLLLRLTWDYQNILKCKSWKFYSPRHFIIRQEGVSCLHSSQHFTVKVTP